MIFFVGREEKNQHFQSKNMLKCCIVYSLMFIFLSDFLETFEEVKANEQVCPQLHCNSL